MKSLTALPDTGPTWIEQGVLFSAADAPLPTIYWPWLVDTAGIPNAGPRWRLYFSTNHDLGAGGIMLATADTVTGPWTQQGVIYTDTVAGSQTETPAVVWVPDTGLWHLYYQQSGVGVNQSTLLATSTDGLSWTRVGVVIDIVPGTVPGDGHTGYAIPHRLPGGRWIAYHLMGGTSWPHFGQSRSADGIVWQVDGRPLGYTTHLVPPGMRTEWNTGYVIQRGAGLWWVGMLSNFTSGGGAKSAIVAQAPIGPDLRTLLAPPATILPAGDHQTINVTTDTDGATWLIYQLGDVFHLMRGSE